MEQFVGPDIQPGSKMTFIGVDGEAVSDTVGSVSYSSGHPEIRREVRWWERFIPARWRKPVVVRQAELPTIQVRLDKEERAEAMRAKVLQSIEELTA